MRANELIKGKCYKVDSNITEYIIFDKIDDKKIYTHNFYVYHDGDDDLIFRRLDNYFCSVLWFDEISNCRCRCEEIDISVIVDVLPYNHPIKINHLRKKKIKNLLA